MRTIAVILAALVGLAIEGESALAARQAPEVAAAASSRVFGWPVGVSAWTVVVATSGSEADASLVARTARNDGLRQAGYLRVGAGPRPWIVFSGVLAHAATNAAERRARAAGFAHARVAFVHKDLTVTYP